MLTIEKGKLEKIVLSQVEDSLYPLMEDLEKNENLYIENYAKQISLIIEEIKNHQSEGNIDEISVLSFELSRIAIDNEIYNYKTKAYKNTLYIDPFQLQNNLDVSHIFSYFSGAKSALHHKCRQNIFGFQVCEVDSELNSCITYFNMFVVNILRKTFENQEIQDSIKTLKISDEFYIVQHEIYQPPYLIFENKAGA